MVGVWIDRQQDPWIWENTEAWIWYLFVWSRYLPEKLEYYLHEYLRHTCWLWKTHSLIHTGAVHNTVDGFLWILWGYRMYSPVVLYCYFVWSRRFDVKSETTNHNWAVGYLPSTDWNRPHENNLKGLKTFKHLFHIHLQVAQLHSQFFKLLTSSPTNSAEFLTFCLMREAQPRGWAQTRRNGISQFPSRNPPSLPPSLIITSACCKFI